MLKSAKLLSKFLNKVNPEPDDGPVGDDWDGPDGGREGATIYR